MDPFAGQYIFLKIFILLQFVSFHTTFPDIFILPSGITFVKD